MKKNTIKYTLSLASLFSPTLALAQPLGGLKGLLISFGGVLKTTIPVLFGLSLVYFFWGLGQFILHDAGNEKTREDGKKKMVWGVVALFVFLSIYGILGAIGSAIGIPVGDNGLPGYVNCSGGGC